MICCSVLEHENLELVIPGCPFIRSLTSSGQYSETMGYLGIACKLQDQCHHSLLLRKRMYLVVTKTDQPQLGGVQAVKRV